MPAYGAGSADPTRLPELRHNLTLLTSTISLNLAALAREGKGVDERRAYINHEEARIRAAVEKQEAAIERLESVSKVVLGIKEIEKKMMALAVAEGGDDLPPKVLLSPFDDEFDELLGKYPEEYVEMKMDEVVVGAIAPIVSSLSSFLLRPGTDERMTGPTTTPELGSTRVAFLCCCRAQAMAQTLPSGQDGRPERH